MKAYDNAKAELSNLKELHVASCFAFEQTEETLRYRIQYKRSLDPNFPFIKPPPRYKHKKFYSLRMISQLRELIFIRLISVLEAYLVDSVRDVFFLNKQPFKDQDIQITFTQAEILSTSSMSYVLSKIINKECRRLTSGGFTEIAKYYRSHFNIDLYSIPPGKVTMSEYHERRHIFVHRLGKPDSKYRQTYSYSGDQLEIDENYLINCMEHFKTYIESIHDYLNLVVNSADSSPNSLARASIKYLVILKKERTSDPSLINEDFHFWVGDEIYALRDILQSKQFLNDRDCQICIAGAPDVLSTYHKHLKRAQKQGHFLVSEQERVGIFKRKFNSNIDAAQLELIQQALPPQPWPTGTHKVVAQRLGLQNSQVSAAIQILISRGQFKHQVNGVMFGES